MIDSYLALGWGLIPIKPNSKVPRRLGWNKRENLIKTQDDLLPGEGIALAHAYSGTMCVDIDHFKNASTFLAKYHVDIKALCLTDDAVCIESGVKGRGKLLYKMPDGLILPSKQVGVDGSVCLEFLCASHAGFTLKNILPPSIHPETNQPYRWSGKGSYTALPTIPAELLSVWQSLLPQKLKMVKHDANQSDTTNVADALKLIPADIARNEWIRIGMALHYASQTNGDASLFDLWDTWSATTPKKYPGRHALMSQWSSFDMTDDDPVTLGTLFDIAREHGYVRPAPDVSALFSKPVDITDKFKTPMPDPIMELWPTKLADMANHVADCIGCDPLVPLYAGMAAVCAVADARSSLEIAPGFVVPPILWLMTVGEPADKKTPGARPMLKVLSALEATDRPIYARRLLEWEAHEAFYAGAKKDFIRNSEHTSPNDVAINVPTLPPRPEPLRLVVKDITSQKLVRLSADNPRGFLCHLDEMASWVKKITDKAGGEDRSAWVVAYEGDSYVMDRVGTGNVSCDNFSVSMFGNIQPEVLRRCADALSADGLLQRYVPACLRPTKTKLGTPKENVTIEGEYDALIRRIHAEDGRAYKLSSEAYAVYRAFQGEYEQRKNDERLLGTDNMFMTAFGKIEGTCARLILLFHIIENPYKLIVEASVVERVVRIVKEFVIPSLKYTLIEMTGVKSVLMWTADKVASMADKEFIGLQDMRRAAATYFRGMFPNQLEDMLIVAMKQLETAEWVVRMDDGKKEHVGIAQWAINPELATLTAERRERIKQADKRVNG